MYNNLLDEMIKFSNGCKGHFGHDYFGRGHYGCEAYQGIPKVNAYDDEEEINIEVVIPGVKKEDININFENDILKIEADKNSDYGEDSTYRMRERHLGKFSKLLKVVVPIEQDSIEAEYKNGILKIKLKKSEAAKPRKIDVK